MSEPIERFQHQALRPLPEFLPDCRDTAPAKVYSDFSIRFDGNAYTVPLWAIGRQVTVKADHHSLTIYLKEKAIAMHARSYQHAERVELPTHREAALKQKRLMWRCAELQAFISLGEEAKTYLEHLSATREPLFVLHHLIAAEADRSLLRKLDYYQSPALLVCDELGYLSLGPQGSHLFFQVNQRKALSNTCECITARQCRRSKVFCFYAPLNLYTALDSSGR